MQEQKSYTNLSDSKGRSQGRQHQLIDRAHFIKPKEMRHNADQENSAIEEKFKDLFYPQPSFIHIEELSVTTETLSL